MRQLRNNRIIEVVTLALGLLMIPLVAHLGISDHDAGCTVCQAFESAPLILTDCSPPTPEPDPAICVVSEPRSATTEPRACALPPRAPPFS